RWHEVWADWNNPYLTLSELKLQYPDGHVSSIYAIFKMASASPAAMTLWENSFRHAWPYGPFSLDHPSKCW
ncbi:hypothetical protein HPP92_027151, partial [Vanilla planifolia]